MEPVVTSGKQTMKVVWLCHFSNSEIRESLPLFRSSNYHDYAPWIPDTLKQLNKEKSIQLYIIAPHAGLKRLVIRFEANNIRYLFFRSDIPLVHKKLWKLSGIFLNRIIRDQYFVNKLIVKMLISSIAPDIIHLQGAENPRYSITALQFIRKYPVVVNLQKASFGYIYDNTKKAKQIEKTEKAILSNFEHFSIRTEQMRHELMQHYPHAKTHWVNFAMPDLAPVPVKKEYDLVFFARLSREKGIEDLIRALPYVHDKIPEVRLLVIGEANPSFLEQIKNLARSLGVIDMITWKGYLPTMKQVYREASKARISVLPAHYDVIPGTIIESMQLGIPVVSYKAGSIPELNEEKDCVLLSEIGDIASMADNIIRLLKDRELYDLIANRGIECIKIKYGNDKIIDQHISCYKSVIRDFHNNSFR